jgi:hypothetical protein
MATCIEGVFGNIANDCASLPIEGIEKKAIVLNFDDIIAHSSVKSKVTSITIASGKQGYSVDIVKKGGNSQSALNTSDILPDSYTHTFDFQIWAGSSANINAITEFNRVVVLVENKNKGVAGDGAFHILGLDNPLYKTAVAEDKNTDSGVFKITAAAGGQKYPYHVFFDTDYATTKTAFEDLLTVAP